jgi:hypothetical protein
MTEFRPKPMPPHRIKTGISAIFNAVPRRIGRGRVFSQSRSRRKRTATTGCWLQKQPPLAG